MMLTIPFVLYAIFRWLYLILVRHEGGAPEEIVLRDRPLQIEIILWGIVIFVALYLLAWGQSQFHQSGLKIERIDEWTHPDKATAPGKITLFGEHAVVYGRPALDITLEMDSSCSFEMDWDGTSNGIAGEATEGLTLQFSIVEPPSVSGFTDCVSITGNNATVGIPADMTINGGFLFAPGDQLAVFTPDNVICAGLATWSGSNIALTVWGDDDQTGVLDGLLSGDEMMFRIWDQSSASELSVSAALYSTGDGIYQPDSLHKLSSLTLSLP